jgi:cysteine desulfurase
MIYLDANATEPLRPEARVAACAAMELTGNPASVHAAGREARRVLEDSRRAVAECLGAQPGHVVFTSGGTEANALAIAGLSAGRRVIVGATEHDAVRAAAPCATVVPVTSDGQVDLAALDRLLREGPALVCLMLANNETGVLHPVAEAAALCRAHGAALHVDAVQAAGRIAFTLAALGADSLAISGHKLGGPKGAGALVMASDMHLLPLIAGGGQERGRRGGTPALPAIAGLAAALRASRGGSRLAPLRDLIEARTSAIVCGAGPRLPNTTCLARPGCCADLQVIALDLAGIAVSAGAACSSGKVADSHVLRAMGLHDLAGCAIRVSLAWNTTAEDVGAFITAYGRLAPARAQAALAPA